MNENKRVKWIDGIKGVACILILVHHYFLGKFPASYYGTARESMCNGLDVYFSQSVFSFFMTGNFFVHLYVLITGYVVTLQVKKMQDNKDRFIPFSVRRYIKLAIPLLVYCLIFFSRNIITDSLSEKITAFNVILCGLVKILFLGSIDFGGHFWMLNVILVGGFAVSIFSANYWHFERKKMVILSLLVLFCILINHSMITILFAACFSGALLFFISESLDNLNFKNRSMIFTVLLFISIFLGAYPSGVIPDNYYRFLILPVAKGLSPYFWHFIASFLFLASVSQLKIVKKFFEFSVIQKIAKYSYSFYICHGMGIESSEFLFNELVNNFHVDYVISSFICLPAAILITFVYAFIFQLVTGFCIKTFLSIKFERK